MIHSGRNLEGEQLDRGMGKDEFWDIIFAKLFDDDERRPVLLLSGVFSNVDSRKPALSYRSGDNLKDVIYKSKRAFTISHQSWSVSGQNDVERIIDFVQKEPQGTGPSVEGKKVLILFTAMRCGTEYEDTDALNFLRKISPYALGHDSMFLSANPSPSTLSTNRKRRADEMNSALVSSFSEAASKISEGMADGLRALASAFSHKYQNAHGVDADDLEMRKLKHRRTLTDSLVNLTNQICEVKRMGSEQEEVVKILEMERDFIKKLLSE